jgi:hypothetical protein
MAGDAPRFGLRDSGTLAAVALLFALPFVLVVLFIKGSIWAVENLLPFLNKASAVGIIGPSSFCFRWRSPEQRVASLPLHLCPCRTCLA